MDRLTKENAQTLWEWNGQSEYNQLRASTKAHKKYLQKIFNRACSGKRVPLSVLNHAQVICGQLVFEEEQLSKLKQIRKKALS
tara:strand:+ start:1452 stop:1700 length:249 start_codon:yes stop_codon:yes gene_type:complete